MQGVVNGYNTDINNKLRGVMWVKFISTINFGFFYSTLSLLLIEHYQLSEVMAGGVAATFFALHYSLQSLGGRLGDAVGNYRAMFLPGKLLQVASFVVLYASGVNSYLLYIGLALFLTDSMVSSVSLNMALTKLSSCSGGRHLSFLRGYIWTNLGFVSAYLISGVFFRKHDYSTLLAVCVFLSIVSFTVSYLFFPDIEGKKVTAKAMTKIIAAMLTVFFAIFILLENPVVTREAVAIIFASLVGVYLYKVAVDYRGEQQKNMLLFILFTLVYVLFWAIYLLGAVFMPIFLKDFVDATVFGVSIPPQWVQVTSALIVVLSGFTLSAVIKKKIGLTDNKASFFAFSLLLVSVALLFLSHGAVKHQSGNDISAVWPLIYMAIMGLSETMIVPANSSLVGELAPTEMQGRLTGLSQITLGLGAVLSGFIADHYLLISGDGAQKISYGGTFNIMAMVIIIAAVGFYTINRVMNNRMTGGESGAVQAS